MGVRGGTCPPPPPNIFFSYMKVRAQKRCFKSRGAIVLFFFIVGGARFWESPPPHIFLKITPLSQFIHGLIHSTCKLISEFLFSETKLRLEYISGPNEWTPNRLFCGIAVQFFKIFKFILK